ncbi:MAG: outer membrane protein assembly factor BamA [Puniceicoccales bacterium]|jgi:outer membrane protein insertion porin family|nr:outer membrane protein assembly factor BamA [Puniceicoccales bacterium]
MNLVSFRGTPIFAEKFTSEGNGKTVFSSYQKKSEQQGTATIAKIRIMVDGKEAKNEDFIRSHIKRCEGDPFNPYIGDEAIHALAAVNIFDDIYLSADQNNEGTLDLTLSMVTRPKIREIEFPHEKIHNKRLRKEIRTERDAYLNMTSINDDKQTIFRHYQGQGFPQPTIFSTVVPTEDPKYVKVIFDIIPGKAQHISTIRFVHFGDVKTEKIRKKMLLKTWSILSFFTKKGYFIGDLLTIDREMMVNEIANAGYLDGKIVRAELRFDEKKKGILEFTAELGQRYFLGKIEFTGNKIYSDDKIHALLSNLKEGDPFSPENIADASERIRNFYTANGYINSDVTVEKIPTFRDNKIAVKFTITEAPLTYVGSVAIGGNYKTKNKVILRELSLAPGDKFNHTKMRQSENRLQNTGFFESVVCDITDGDVPDHKHIQIDVKEKNTGNIQAGGAISAKNNQCIFLEISQSNFDLLGSKAKFQGSGQKARARIQVGNRMSQLRFSFEEPYLFDRELAFGVDVFGNKTKYRQSDSNYSGPDYEQTDIGFEPYFRKRIYELWSGRLAYNFTHKNIRNVSNDAVQPLKDETGKRNSSRIKFAVERDTRDNYIFPRTGNFLSLGTQFAGLGGQTKLFSLDLHGTKWITISEKYDHNLAMALKMGTIFPFAGKQTPFSERYFLGGDSLMRGFEFREISPKDSKGNSLGGNSFIYGCLEYTANLFDDFYLAAFTEVGNVNAQHRLFKHGLNVDAGLGLRIFIAGMPLRLDWGYPIRCGKDVKKNGVQFNFSFGLSF